MAITHWFRCSKKMSTSFVPLFILLWLPGNRMTEIRERSSDEYLLSGVSVWRRRKDGDETLHCIVYFGPGFHCFG